MAIYLERHKVGLTPGDLRIASPSPLHSICFLSPILTYREGPVLHVDLLSHFSHICSSEGKNRGTYIYMRKLICCTDLTDDPLFCRTGVHACGSAKIHPG